MKPHGGLGRGAASAEVLRFGSKACALWSEQAGGEGQAYCRGGSGSAGLSGPPKELSFCHCKEMPPGGL